MKKNLLLASLFAFTTLNAQITLDSSDFPGADSVYIFGVDTFHTDFDLGSASPNAQTWNFYKLHATYVDSLNYLQPATAPGSGSFPNADMALLVEMEGEIMHIFFNTDSHFYAIGAHYDASAYGFGQVTTDADPPEPILLDSTNYGDSFGSNTKYEFQFDQNTTDGTDTLFILNIDKNAVADAWGDIITPLDTFNVLRLEEHRITSGVIEFRYLGVPIYSIEVLRENVYNYQFWSKGIGHPVATATMDSLKQNLLQTQFLFPDSFALVSADFNYDQPGRDSVVFTNNSVNATSYKWFFGDGTVSTEAEPNHVYPDSGQYIVSLRATNVGSIDYHKDTITVEPSAIHNLENGVVFSIYPNPAVGQVKIELQKASAQYKLEVINILGQIVLTQDLKESNTISLQNLTEGLYLYQLKDEKGKVAHTGKLLINR